MVHEHYRQIATRYNVPNRPRILDRSHSLTAGMVFLYVPAIANVNLFSLGHLPSSSALDWRFTENGIAARNGLLSLADTPELDFTNYPWTVAVWFRQLPGALEVNKQIFVRARYVAEGNNQGWGISTSNHGGAYDGYVFNNNSQPNYYNVAGIAPRVAGEKFIAMRVNAAGNDIFIRDNYNPQFPQLNHGAGVNVAASNVLGTGVQLDDGSVTELQPVYAAYAWSRDLSNDEIYWLSQEPLPFLVERRQKSIFPGSGGGGGGGGGSSDVDIGVGGSSSVGGVASDVGSTAGVEAGSGAGAGAAAGEGARSSASSAVAESFLPQAEQVQAQAGQQGQLSQQGLESPFAKFLEDLFRMVASPVGMLLLLLLLLLLAGRRDREG